MANMFEDRKGCGEFCVAGVSKFDGKTRFYHGFNMSHRKDYSKILESNKIIQEAIQSQNISNIKFHSHGAAYYCHFCGCKLIEFYGSNGGALLDQAYFDELHNFVST